MRRKVLKVALLMAVIAGCVGCGGKDSNQAINDIPPVETIDFLWDDTKASLDNVPTVAVKESVEGTENKTKSDSEKETNSANKETQKATEKATQKEPEVVCKEFVNIYMDNKMGRVYINDLKGKTIQAALDNGCICTGYVGTAMDSEDMKYQIGLTYKKETPETTKIIDSLKGTTVAQLKKKYFGISIDTYGDRFGCTVGSVRISFDLDNGAKAIKGHEDDFFFDLEDASEVQNDVLKNIKFVEIDMYGNLDAASNEKLNKINDLGMEDVKKMYDELTFENVMYDIK